VGCRLDVGTDVAFDARGGGEVTIAVRIDGATLRELDRYGADPGLDVELALGPDSGWTTGRRIDADGGLVLTYTRRFADGDEATALLRELSEGVAPQDPAVRLDVTVTTTSRARCASTGRVASSAGDARRQHRRRGGRADGEELAALVADAVRAELVVRVAGTDRRRRCGRERRAGRTLVAPGGDAASTAARRRWTGMVGAVPGGAGPRCSSRSSRSLVGSRVAGAVRERVLAVRPGPVRPVSPAG
jgi:hypothetical protein